jgi:hypothetical protein
MGHGMTAKGGSVGCFGWQTHNLKVVGLNFLRAKFSKCPQARLLQSYIANPFLQFCEKCNKRLQDYWKCIRNQECFECTHKNL